MKCLRLSLALFVFPFLSAVVAAQSFQETPDITISPDTCSLYPLTIPDSLVGSAQPGALFNNINLGSGPGNYSWLSWAGPTDTNTLATSLASPGNSHTYRNPNNSGDGQLNAGDWVEGTPGVKNGNAVRNAMDALLGRNIIVPVWSTNERQGANFDYLTARFAVVELTDYRLNGHGYISFVFKRFTRCYNHRPVARDGNIETPEDTPVTFTLNAEDADDDVLVYEILSEPAKGVIEVDGNQVTYTPNTGYYGPDELTFIVHDNEQLSNIARVDITVVQRNEPPVIVSPPLETTPEQQTYRYPVEVEDLDLDPIHFELDRAPAGMAIDGDSGVISWLPDERFVQTVPSFNQQCYVVPSGSVKEYEEGDENGGQTYIAPLFNRVRSAIKSAGEYVAPQAISWHQNNGCLGCHIQTQSVLGLQASLDKAEIDEDAAAYLLGEILNSQLGDGSIRRSHPEHAKNQTAFALWALSFVPDRQATFDVRARGLEFFWSRRISSGDSVYWTTDHNSGWLSNTDSINALITLSAVRYIVDSRGNSDLTSLQQNVVENYTSLLPAIAEYTLSRTQSSDDANLGYAFRLITLGELRKLVSEPELLVRIDAATDSIDTLLRGRQEADGGWSPRASGTIGDPLTSAWVGLALDYLDPAITDPAVNANIEFLLDSQQPNGTWLTNSGLFTTRLAATSLVMAYLPVALEHLGNPDVRPGHIYLTEGEDGIHQLSARVGNRGLAEIIVPVDVAFYSGTPETGALLGSVRLERIDSGQVLSPTIEVTDENLTDDIHVTLTVDPEAEECEINNNRTQAALVRLRATDPGDLFDTQVFALNVDDVNQGPEITSEAPENFQSGQAFHYRVTVEDGDAVDAHLFSLIDAPEGLFIDPRTGVISAAPGVLPPGTYSIVVEVEDLRGATTQQIITLTIHENLPPEIVSAPVIRGDEATGYQYDVDAVDPNPGDELTYSFEAGPEGLGIGSSSGLVAWTGGPDFVEGHTGENSLCIAQPEQATGQFEPVVKWQWPLSGATIYGPVSVGQFTDDNGDGVIDGNDSPDIVAVGSRSGSFVALVDGATGNLHWNTTAFDNTSLGSTAIGDLDLDGVPEIYVLTRNRLNLLVIGADGNLIRSVPTELPRFSGDTRDGVTLADLDGDGVAEIVVGRNVLNQDGSIRWQGSRDYGGDLGYGVVPVVADVNLDGSPEVIAGRSIYSSTGVLLSHNTQIPRDGFTAVGNFDGNDFAEIVVVGGGRISLMDHQGNLLWGPHAIPGGGFGGAPTIGDFDGDDEVEVGVAGARNYVVYETDGTEKWRSPTRDDSSHRTGSSLFDFESDGAIEVVYADENYLRVYDGATGEIRLEVANISGTTLEYPVIADIDNDGAAEILAGSSASYGLRAFEDANDSWAPTRAIWNQHAYSINNINDDLTVPANPVKSWLTHNSFRLNTFPDRPALGLPDLTAHSIAYDERAGTVSVKVKNRGLAPVNAPIAVSFVHEHFWSGDQSLGEQTINRLEAGEEIEILLPLSGQELENSLRVDLSVAEGVRECVTDNNSARAAIVDVSAYDPAGLFDTQKFAVSIANVNDAPQIVSAASSQAFSGQDYAFQVEVADPDRGETFEYSLLDAPEGVSIGTHSGEITGAGLAEGVYPFVVQVRDVAGAAAEQPHLLTVSPPDNFPPEITSEPPAQVGVGEEYVYDVTATDPDGDPLLYALSRSQAGMIIDQNSGRIRWTPRSSDVGVKSAEVTVVDAKGAAATQYFLIDVTDTAAQENLPPVITSVPSGAVYAGKVFEYQVEASDPDGDTLAYALETTAGGMSITDTGLFSWLPDPSLVGQQVIVDIRVSDGRGDTATQKLTLPVNEGANHPPIITSLPALQAMANDPYQYAVEASDEDGDSFSFSLLEAPNGMTLSGNIISWTPGTVQAGQLHSVALLARDARGASSTQTFGIAVNAPLPPNAAPVIDSLPTSPAFIGEEYGYDLIARDPDGDSLTYSLSTAPAGMTISAVGELRWMPDVAQEGLHDVAIEVSDGRAWIRQRYTLQAVVRDVNNYPLITSWPRTLTAATLSYSYQLEATDADGDPLTFGALESPEGMSISPDGLVQWTPGSMQVGMHDVVLFADDGKGRTLQSFSVNVTEQPLPLSTSILVTPEIVNPGDAVTISIFNEGGQGDIEAELWVDGIEVPLDPYGQTQVTAGTIGVHTIDVLVTDGVDIVQSTSTYSVRDTLDTEAPVVHIAAPADDALVTSPADIIGTVQDDNLAHYRVLMAPKGQQDYTEIASGSRVVDNAALGLLDPTLLHNGLYQIVLEATDVNGQVAIDGTTVLVDGDMKVGHFALSFEDLSVDLAGIPIRVTRTYDTRQRAESLDFGHGWSVDYQNLRLQESRTLGFSWSLNYYRNGFFGEYCVEPNGDPIVTVRLPDGDLEKFRAKAVPECTSLVPTVDVHIAFEPLEGTRSVLEQTDYGLLRLANGDIIDLSDPQPIDPDSYRLTTPDGLVYSLDQGFGVRRITEPGGEFVTYSDSGIHHSQGYAIQFERDAANRITAMVTPDGRRIEYGYSFQGDLETVTDPSGDVTSHSYLFRLPHYLEEVIDPRGVRATRMEYDDSGRLIAVVDADGNRVEYEHDIAGNTEIVRDRNGNQTVYVYDESGRVTAETNALGETITRSYNDVGDMLSETNDLGETTSWTYDAKGNQLTETNALGFTTEYSYTDNGQVLTETNALGNEVVSNSYNPRSLKLEDTTDALGNTTDFHWDAGIGGGSCSTGASRGYTDAEGNTHSIQPICAGPLAHLPRYEIDADGTRTDFEYDSNGWKTAEVTTRTGADGSSRTLRTEYEHDAEGRVIATTHPDGTTTRTEYNAIDKVAAEIDALGRRTEYEYDNRGHEVLVRYPDGSTEAKAYDKEGNLIAETDRAGRTTGYEYDAANRQIATILPDDTPFDDTDNPRTRTEYNRAGRVSAIVDANGNRTEYEYDTVGQRTLVRDALGNETHYEYDALGRRTAMVDARANRTEYVYDAVGRLTETRYPDGTATQIGYDALGRKTSETDELGRITRYDYDPLGRLVKVTDAEGNITEFGYDEQGNKVSQTDAEGRVTRWIYDDMGRQTSRILPLGQVESFTYDQVGNVIEHKDFNGDITINGYDSNHRLIESTFADGSREQFHYSANGQRSEAAQIAPDGSIRTTTFTYDAVDRLESETKPDGTVLNYEYDAAGNKTRLIVTLPDGTEEITTYGYDVLNRLQSVTDNTGTTSYGYDPTGNRASVSHANGTSQVYSYDTRNRLTRLETYNGSGALVQSYDYTLLPTGHRERIVELNGRSTVYSYDSLHRLTGETITDPINGGYSASYQYDKVGNRTSETVDGVHTQYTYDDNDRLLQTGSTTFSYDEQGNTLSQTLDGNTISYGYNSQHELVSQMENGTITEFAYDADGIRTAKSDGTTATRFLIDNNLDYAQVLREESGTSVVSYTYGDDLISQNRNGQISYYLYDGLGSTRALADGSGTITDEYHYQVFGDLLNQTGSTDNNYLFAGEQFDETLSQYYLRARYYSQQVGRFTQMDTWMANGYGPITLHKYLYANADPVNWIDPSGYFGLADVGAALNIRGIQTASAQASFRVTIRKIGRDLACVAIEETVTNMIMQQLTGGVYILADNGAGYVGRTNDFERRMQEHARSSKRKVEKVLALFHMEMDRNEQRLVEQFFMDLFRDANQPLTNTNNSISRNPSSTNSRNLRRMMNKLDFCG